ncbi:hypothetical protein MF545_20405, partial [Stenotrophomonas maltophilia]|nr:hypothetical protein [Stenotrophomonas maltophilia]
RCMLDGPSTLAPTYRVGAGRNIQAMLDCFARLRCLNTLDASDDNGEDGAWFFWLALHGATHP